MSTKTRIQLKHDTSENWKNSTLQLLVGEFAYDTTNRKLKIGDGTSTFDQLSGIQLDISDVIGLSSRLDSLVSGLKFAGVFDQLSDYSDPQNGDIVIRSSDQTEWIYLSAESEQKWEQFGDPNAWDPRGSAETALNTAKTYSDTQLNNFKTITTVNGETTKIARIFNETDGGGAKFEVTDVLSSYVGVNDPTGSDIAGQLYVLSNDNGTVKKTKLNMYYGQFCYIKPTDNGGANPASSERKNYEILRYDDIFETSSSDKVIDCGGAS